MNTCDVFKPEVFFFSNNGKDYVYDINTGNCFPADDLLVRLLRAFNEHGSLDPVIGELQAGYPPEQIEQYATELKGYYSNGDLFNKQAPDSFDSKIRTIKKMGVMNLWLNVSHDCNLRCRYCFGHGGDYGGKRDLMTPEMAKKCIDLWFNQLEISGKAVAVTFFGGEPLMNLKTIRFAIKYLDELLPRKNCKAVYGITTNGTICNQELIELMRQHHILPLISIDGLEDIQNRNRPLKNGTGSYSRIRKNIERFKQNFEALQGRITLTHADIPRLLDSVKFLWQEGFTDVYVEEVSIKDETLALSPADLDLLKRTFDQLTEITYTNILKGTNRYFTNILKICFQIHHRFIGNTCSFQNYSTLMFSPSGEIYKCHRMMDSRDYLLGTVAGGLDEPALHTDFIKSIDDRLCKDCWARYICGGGCAQENLTYTNDINEPYRIKCEIVKYSALAAFRLYTELHEHDPDLLENFFSIDNKTYRM